mgnify:CR=1 FL=1
MMFGRFLTLLFTFVFVCTFHSSEAQANRKYASIIIDAETGIVLEQQYADKHLHPASLTKIMTLLLLFEEIEKDRVGFNDRIRVSRHAANMVPSKLGLKAGSSIRVKDAINALVTKSANDVAVAIAEKIGGSEKSFARMMTRKARDIGMSNTTFRNASGLHNRRQVSTARDMAKLARYVIRNYPQEYKFFSLQKFTYAGKTYRNHNRLMGKYKGMDGMKTGYISAAGFNLVASAVRNDRRIIAVVFGGRTSRSRNAHMEVLLNRGFRKINDIRIAKADIPLPPRKPVFLNALAALSKVSEHGSKQIASMNTEIGMGFRELIGQGDFDVRLAKRIETGLMAISAHTKKNLTVPFPAQKISQHSNRNSMQVYNVKNWSIQIGAYKSRAQTDKVLHAILTKLPSPYSKAQPLIAPLKTRSGWIFRGRLTGFSEKQAYAACRHLKDCLPVAPRN